MSEYQDTPIQMYKKLMRFFLEREIADFYKFLNILDGSISVRRQELSNSIAIADTNLEDLDKNDKHRKEWINLQVEAEQLKGFTNLLRQSFLISLYSFMELWLIRECYLDSERRDSGKSYESMKGQGIQKAKEYFTNIMKSNYPFSSSQDWLWITNLKLLRHCIIHRQGSLTGFSDFKVDSRLAKFVNDEHGLSLFGTDNQQIFIEYEFCLKALQTIHRFMINLLALE